MFGGKDLKEYIVGAFSTQQLAEEFIQNEVPTFEKISENKWEFHGDYYRFKAVEINRKWNDEMFE